MTLNMIETHLARLGYTMIMAINGLTALEEIQKNKFDLIISDIMMPKLSGINLLELLQQNYHLKTPILFISSSSKFDGILQSLGFGAGNLMHKPLDFTDLTAKVKKLIESSTN